ncbi:hypothetical protein V1318_05260 [Lysobacter sp. CCNWLW3]|uniref:hypothetical protein n=1 Tax=unclassified Lysobacter TaxID=2635362 RepID=UPI002FD4DC2B
MSDANFDWGRLGDEWRAQPDTGIDVDRLREEVSRRGRNLRRALLGEVALTAMSVATLVWLILKAEASDPMRPVFVLLIPVSIAFQAWSLWLRRRQWRDEGLDTAAMLQLDIDRIQAGMRYWRQGTWIGLLLWLGVCAFAVLGIPDSDPRQLSGIVGGVIGGAIGVLISVAMAWLKSRSGRRRLARLLELQRQLSDA